MINTKGKDNEKGSVTTQEEGTWQRNDEHEQQYWKGWEEEREPGERERPTRDGVGKKEDTVIGPGPFMFEKQC